jgi:hypothetical protein
MYLTIENSIFFGNAWATEATDNDKGFNDQMAVEDPARRTRQPVDPGLTATGDLTMATVTPNYVPPATATGLNMQATPPAPFITTATYAGAFAPGGRRPLDGGLDRVPHQLIGTLTGAASSREGAALPFVSAGQRHLTRCELAFADANVGVASPNNEAIRPWWR